MVYKNYSTQQKKELQYPTKQAVPENNFMDDCPSITHALKENYWRIWGTRWTASKQREHVVHAFNSKMLTCFNLLLLLLTVTHPKGINSMH
jgi:hypothetical protein